MNNLFSIAHAGLLQFSENTVTLFFKRLYALKEHAFKMVLVALRKIWAGRNIKQRARGLNILDSK